MLTVEYLPGARLDFDESFDWYAGRSTAAAVRFTAAVDAALAWVSAAPMQFASSDGVHRECPVHSFPFRIVYRVANDRLIVVAVAHAKRQHNYWHGRPDL